jgi:hypothetical protein
MKMEAIDTIRNFGGELPASGPGRFTPWERALGTRWRGPTVCLDDVKNRK